VLERHVETVIGQERTGAVGPLDDRDPTGVETLFPTGVREVDAFEAIEIDVKEREPPTGVVAHDDEGRARDLGGVDAEADRDPARKDGLARSELARECEDVVRSCHPSETLPETLGVERGVAHEVEPDDFARSITHSRRRAGTSGARDRVAPVAAPSMSCHGAEATARERSRCPRSE